MADVQVKTYGVNDPNDPFIKDGLENFTANLGTEMDKRNHSNFVNNKHLSRGSAPVELNAMYRTDWMSGKVVDIVPNDMTREWRSFISEDLETEDRERLEKEERRLGLVHNWNLAHKWARLYGTAFIVMSIDDGKDPKEPVDIESLKEGCLKHIKVLDRHRIQRGYEVELNPLNANFGMPLTYRLNETTIAIHHSRVIRFDAVQIPFEEFRRNNYWSDSVLDRLYESITNFNTAADSAAGMIYESNVDIIKIKGLMQYLSTPEQEKLLRKRFSLAGTLKSNNNMLLLDSDEAFESKNNTFSGLPDLIAKYLEILAAASDIPATRLLGASPTGLNATGEGDLKNYYDKISSDQNFEYRPKLDVFDKILAKSVGIKDDYSILEYEFNSLFQMSPAEQATIDYNNAQRDQTYLDQGVLLPSMVAEQLNQAGTYTSITTEHIKQLQEEEKDADNSNAFTNIGELESVEETENEEDEGGEDI